MTQDFIFNSSSIPIVKLLNAYYNDKSNAYITHPYLFSENEKPTRGDHIRVKRYGGLYYHHGIYESDQKVYNFQGENLEKLNAEIRCTTLDKFIDGNLLQVRILDSFQKSKAFSAEERIQLAKSCIGEKGYFLLSNNCEHFANLCLFGIKRSKQVEDLKDFVDYMQKKILTFILSLPFNYTFESIAANINSHAPSDQVINLEKFYRD